MLFERLVSLNITLTEVWQCNHVVIFIHDACNILKNNLKLFCNVLNSVCTQFVSYYTSVHIFEVDHCFADNVFKEPDVVLSHLVKY